MTNLLDKTILITGVRDRRSIATAVTKVVREAGAKCIFLVKDEKIADSNSKLWNQDPVFVCDFESAQSVEKAILSILKLNRKLSGVVHSIAYGDLKGSDHRYSEIPFSKFIQAIKISAYSLNTLASGLRESLEDNASFVTYSVPDSDIVIDGYGIMAAAKNVLESSVTYLAEEFGINSQIRFNCICSGLLKTNSAAAIPGFIDLHEQNNTQSFRKKGVTHSEVANLTTFLLSDSSSGINGQKIVIDAGASKNLSNTKFRS